MGGEGATVPRAGSQGVAYPGRTRCAQISPPAVPNHKARSRAAPGGHEGSEPPGHANVDTDALPMIRAAGKSPVLPARRLWPRGKPACIVPAAPSAARPCRSHGTVAPSPRTTRRESRRSSKEHRLMRRRKEGRKEECSVVSVVLVQRMERLVTFVAIFGGSGFFTCSKRERVQG